MPSFPAEPQLEPYPDGKTWYLLAPLVYVRDSETITVPSGFETDFASIPRVFWNVLPPYAEYGRAAIVHDWLYWNQPKPRAEADAIFLEAMVCLGVPWWKRQCLYWAVRWFGQTAWDDNTLIGAQGYSRIHTEASPETPEWNKH